MLKKLIRIFLSTGIPFGILMGFFTSLRHGMSGVVSGLLAGAVFGGFMAGVLGYLHNRSVKQKTTDGAESDYDVKQTKEIELPVSYETAYELCIESLDKLNKAEIENKDHSQGVITAKTGKTWDTWGNTVSFVLTDKSDNVTNILVSSEPTHYQVVDYGKNLKNVNTIIAYLEERSV